MPALAGVYLDLCECVCVCVTISALVCAVCSSLLYVVAAARSSEVTDLLVAREALTVLISGLKLCAVGVYQMLQLIIIITHFTYTHT